MDEAGSDPTSSASDVPERNPATPALTDASDALDIDNVSDVGSVHTNDFDEMLRSDSDT